MRVENRQNKSDDEEEASQVAGEFNQHVGGLRTKDILGHATAKGSAKSLAFRALHQDHQDHKQGHEGPDGEKNGDQDGHGDGEYVESGGWRKRRVTGYASAKLDFLFHPVPDCVQFREAGLSEFAASGLQFFFHAIETTNKLVGRALQEAFGIET